MHLNHDLILFKLLLHFYAWRCIIINHHRADASFIPDIRLDKPYPAAMKEYGSLCG